MVVNSAFGLGDEVLRTVPLLDAILRANPDAHATIVTRRPFLFDHPRVNACSIFDEGRLEAILRADYEGVAHFVDRSGPYFNLRFDLIDRLKAVTDDRRLQLVLEGGHADHRFVFDTVRVGGEEIATTSGLDQQVVKSAYAPTLRLLAELGLPIRFGEADIRASSVLTAAGSADADRLWQAIIRTVGSDGPVALVNPFGGSAPEKGHTDTDRLAAELAGLLDECFRLVLLPNGTPWGHRRLAEAAVQRLPRQAHCRVGIAPDPSEPGGSDRKADLRERPELPCPDRLFRLFKSFAARADLIVTVEGWLGHLAYNLGRP